MSTTTVQTSIDVTSSKLVAPEPEHCPGPESAQAGKGDACAGCPNQSICQSNTPKGPDPDIPVIAERLAGIRHKIVVLSGKGGVGKSTFSALLAQALARRVSEEKGDDVWGTDGGVHAADAEADDDEAGTPTVGIMDTDVCGPSIPKMLGVESETVHISGAGWDPVWVTDNLAAMSVQFMLPDRDAAVIWRGPKKTGLIKQFLKDVDWSTLDYLLVDTPPGTSDEHLAVNTYMRAAGLTGAVLVTTPQEVALLDVRKEIDFCRKAGIRILGLVENMAAFVCPRCTTESQIFRSTTGGGAGLAYELGLPFLGSVPLDPRVGMACDYGESFLDSFPDSPATLALGRVVDVLLQGISHNDMKTNGVAK